MRPRAELEWRNVDRPGRVGQVVVAQDDDGVAPGGGEIEGALHERDRLGHVHRRQHEVAVVAVAAAPGRLPVVALRPRHVQDDQGKAGQGHLGQRLLHE